MYNQSLCLHFVGIGGVGMAGIAEVLLNLGYFVSGSDAKVTPLSEHLKELGATITYGHNAEHVLSRTDFVIVSSAIKADNPELVEARRRGIPIILRAEMLAELMRMKYGIAVAGSHGKTTTTSMIAKILGDGGLDPTVIVGGRVLSKRSGARLGRGKYLVAETDESDGSFGLIRPAIAVVTNIDREHVSHYGSFGALEKAFFDFMSATPFYGVVVACLDDPVVASLVKGLKRRVISYGQSPAFDYCASDFSLEGLTTNFKVTKKEGESTRVHLPLPGRHLALNAMAALAVGVELGVSLEQGVKTLSAFPGVSRRSELVTHHRGIRIIDDYAHHPREIQATLSAIRQGCFGGTGSSKLIVLFEPHRYSRVQELFSEFITAFSDADELLIGDIYPAGEDPLVGISGESLCQAMQHNHAKYIGNLEGEIPTLVQRLQSGDVVVTVGAGNVSKIAHELAEELVGRDQFRLQENG